MIARRLLSPEPMPSLGSGVGCEGVEEMHPWVARARRRAASPRTVWRLFYNLPPTDPRVLEATEEDVWVDLLTLHFRTRGDEEARDPSAAEARDLEGLPELAAELAGGLKARFKAFLDDPAVQAFLHVGARGRRRTVAPTVNLKPFLADRGGVKP